VESVAAKGRALWWESDKTLSQLSVKTMIFGDVRESVQIWRPKCAEFFCGVKFQDDGCALATLFRRFAQARCANHLRHNRFSIKILL
jgi:hypothetical protein